MKILYSADLHLLGKGNPISRLDNYQETQIRKLQFITDIITTHKAISIIGGDIVEKALGVSPSGLLATILFSLQYLPKSFCIAGNHDLTLHSLDYLMESAIAVGIQENKLDLLDYRTPMEFKLENVVLFGYNYGQRIQHVNEKYKDTINIAIYHGYVDEHHNNLIDGCFADEILEEFHNDYKWILTGDNHSTFIKEYNGSTLINPGSILRRTGDQINHKPCVFLIDTENNIYEQIFIPIKDNVLSREHLDEQKEKDNRFETFIEVANSDYEIGFSFEENMKNYLLSNEEIQKVKDYIYESMETIK